MVGRAGGDLSLASRVLRRLRDIKGKGFVCVDRVWPGNVKRVAGKEASYRWPGQGRLPIFRASRRAERVDEVDGHDHDGVRVLAREWSQVNFNDT